MEFLRRISRILAADDPALPDLRRLEVAGQLVLLPLGGNGPQPWIQQLASLGKSTFFLFDREMPPESEQRQASVSQLNADVRCRAFVTKKRSLENYLHSQAIYEAYGIQLRFGDDDAVAELAARQLLLRKGIAADWITFPSRVRKRLRDQAKRWLNREAVDRMTPARLAERDRGGEVRHWLHTIGQRVSPH